MQMKHKVVYHGTYGGFNLSEIARKRLIELGHELTIEYLKLNNNDTDTDGAYYSLEYDIERHDPLLIQVIEELGSLAGNNLKIVEIDSDLYYIKECDGAETVETPESLNWVVIK